MASRHWSQVKPRTVCLWPTYRAGREVHCGGPVYASQGRPRCEKHEDTRSLEERTRDPLGPYHQEVHRIQTRIQKERAAARKENA